jgi:hypothetical protein
MGERRQRCARTIGEIDKNSTGFEEVKARVVETFSAQACGKFALPDALGDSGPIGSTADLCLHLRLRDGQDSSIELFLYDDWAHKFDFIRCDDEITMSGSRDQIAIHQAAEANDNPLCIWFYEALLPKMKEAVLGVTLADDTDTFVRAISGDSLRRLHPPCRMDDRTLTSERILRKRRRPNGGGSPARVTRSSSATLRRQSAHGKSYTYTKLSDVSKFYGNIIHVFGLVVGFSHPKATRGDQLVTVQLVDPTFCDTSNPLVCNIFCKYGGELPRPACVGSIMRIHRVKVQFYKDRPQLLCPSQGGASWMLVARRSLLRSALQEPPPPAPIRYLDDGDDGEGQDEASDIVEGFEAFHTADWEVSASTKRGTTCATDADRAEQLTEWFVDKAKEMRLTADAGDDGDSSTITVNHMLQSPPPTAENMITCTRDIVACVVQKFYTSDRVLSHFYLWDGTGTCEDDKYEQSLNMELVRKAIWKGMAYAKGDRERVEPAQIPTAGAILKVGVSHHAAEVSALLGPSGERDGIWVRIRKLSVSKDHRTVVVSLNQDSSINLLPPDLLNVREIYSNHENVIRQLKLQERSKFSVSNKPLSNLADALGRIAPHEFCARVRVKGHIPQDVRKFRRLDADGKHVYFYLVQLMDDTAEIDAIVCCESQHGILVPLESPEHFRDHLVGNFQESITNCIEGNRLLDITLRCYVQEIEPGGEGYKRFIIRKVEHVPGSVSSA